MATVPTTYEKVLRCDFCGVTHVEGSLTAKPQATVMELLALKHNADCLLLTSIPTGGYFIPVSSGTEDKGNSVEADIFTIGVAVKRVNV